MLITFAGLGIELLNIEDGPEPIIYISVPTATTDTGPDGLCLARKALADRIYTKLNEMGLLCKIKFKVRDEVWTNDKRIEAETKLKLNLN